MAGDEDTGSPATAVEKVRSPQLSSRTASLTRGTLVGRYVVMDTLGEGGMGVVYAAYDPDLNRRVALKLMLSHGGEDGGARMLREAQALARLSHPNVVGVFDVGTIGGRVFLAMELVEGQTLSAWLRAAPRSWREIIAVFQAAGGGLAAAHAAGVIHRDFKPSNVIVGNDHRVRVLDFGLARAISETATNDPIASSTGRDVLGEHLTQTGSVLGTPVYMPPEAYRGEPVREAGDQFSFCVALYEALYGKRPFSGSWSDPKDSPPPPVPPADSDVPPWVRRIVLQGLAVRATDRHASMEALLAAVGNDPAVKRRRRLGAGAAMLALTGIVTLMVRWPVDAHAADPCAQAAPLGETWGELAQDRVRLAFVRSGVRNPAEAFTRTSAALDEWSRGWLGARRDACEDTRQRHTQPEAVLVLRLACLDSQKQDFEALSALFERADSAIATNAAQAVRGLSRPTVCANARSLSYVQSPPITIAAEVALLGKRLSAARALIFSGKGDAARVELQEVVASARALDYAPLLADALYLFGREEMVNVPASLASLDEAESVAVAGRVDPIAARAAAFRFSQGTLWGRTEAELTTWEERARAWVQRDGDLEAEFDLQSGLANRAESKGKHDEAIASFKRALDVAKQAFDAANSRVFGVQCTYAIELILVGRFDEAAATLRPAIDAFEKAYGDESTVFTVAVDNYGLTLTFLGRYEEAHAAFEHGLRIRTAPDWSRGAIMCDLSRLLLAEGHVDDAIAKATEGLAKVKTSVDPFNVAINVDALAAAYAAAGRHADALEQSRDCLTDFKRLDDQSTDLVPCLVIEGAALVDLGKPAEAMPELEKALALQLPRPAPPGALAILRFQLARALVATGGDRTRAKQLAAQAREELVRYPFKKQALDDVDGWIARSQL